LIVIFLLIFSTNNIFSFEKSVFNGIWKCTSTKNPNDDAYIAITQVNENELFIVYVDPYWEHRYDYAEYGKLADDGYILVSANEMKFYLEISQNGNLYHYLRSFDDPHPSRFEKVYDKETMEKNKNPLNKVTNQALLDFINSQNQE